MTNSATFPAVSNPIRSPILDHRQDRTVPGFEPLEHHIDHFVRFGGRKVGSHEVADPPIWTGCCQARQQFGPRQDADDSFAGYHRKVVLESVERPSGRQTRACRPGRG